MNEGGVGRSGGLTNWYLMDVASMWACLADQDTTGHWRQVAGWRKICDLAQTHLARLQEYRRGLAEAWPPETNEASRAYLAELDQLIEKVHRTHDAAATNYTALSAATQAIGTTRETLRKIHDEYAAKVQQKRAYDATVADPKAIMGNRSTEPPVADGELERLNVQARGIMYGLSSELQQAQVMLRQPPPTKPLTRQPSEPDVYGPQTAPVIPPIVPFPLIRANPSRATPSEAIRAQVSAPTSPGVGPILGSTGTGLTPASASAGFTGAPQTSPSPPVGPNAGVPPLTGNVSRPTFPKPSHEERASAGGTNNAPRLSPLGTSRPSPPGGLIGGLPGAGLGQPAPNSPTRRVNPIGGVIGGGGAGTGPTGGAGSRPGGVKGFAGSHTYPPIGGSPLQPGMGGTGPVPGRSGRRESTADARRAWDPDYPWSTDRGVDPIVRPPDEDGPLNPGPAIGFDR